MGVYANLVADKERIREAKQALVALGVVAIMPVAMAVMAVPAHAFYVNSGARLDINNLNRWG